MDGGQMDVFVSHIVGMEGRGGARSITLQYDYGKWLQPAGKSVVFFPTGQCAENTTYACAA